MVQRESSSPAPRRDDGAAAGEEVVSGARPRAPARLSVQFDVPPPSAASVTSPSPRGPRSASRRTSRTQDLRRGRRHRRFSCFYASSSPYYALCRDIVQNRVQDEAVLSTSQTLLVALGTLHEEVMRRGLYINTVTRIDTAQLEREQTQGLLPPAAVMAGGEAAAAPDVGNPSSPALGVRADSSCSGGDVVRSPLLASLRLFPLHEDLTQRQVLAHLAYLHNVPLLDVSIPSRLTAMKVCAAVARFQFEYVVEPLLQHIAMYLLSDESVTAVAPTTAAESTTSTAAEGAAGVDWNCVGEQLAYVVASSWGRADVGSVEPFADSVQQGPPTEADRRRDEQARYVEQAALSALHRTVGSETWRCVLRAVLDYGLTTGAESETVLRYSLILRLKVMEHYDGRDPALHRTEMKSRHVPEVPVTTTTTAADVSEEESSTLDWSEAHRVAVDAVIRDVADDFYGREEEATQARRAVAASAVLDALRAQAHVEERDATDASPERGTRRPSRAALVVATHTSSDEPSAGRRPSLNRLSALSEPAQGLLAALLHQTQSDGIVADGLGDPVADTLAQLAEEACDGAAPSTGPHSSQVGHIAASPASPSSPVLGSHGLIEVMETPAFDRSASSLHEGSLTHSAVSRRGPARGGAMDKAIAEHADFTARATAARRALLDYQQQFVIDVTVELVVACVQRLLQELRYRPHQGFVAAIRFGSASYPAASPVTSDTGVGGQGARDARQDKASVTSRSSTSDASTPVRASGADPTSVSREPFHEEANPAQALFDSGVARDSQKEGIAGAKPKKDKKKAKAVCGCSA